MPTHLAFKWTAKLGCLQSTEQRHNIAMFSNATAASCDQPTQQLVLPPRGGCRDTGNTNVVKLCKCPVDL